MWWLYLYVGLATAGILLLGVLGIRVFAAVQDLARQVGRSTDELSRASQDLSRVTEPLIRRAGDTARN
ncbi:hypothetical protein [Streptomyces sp. NBC_01262]|jgi:UPF0716 family protein affecting phage T7 exclusion|uniref:hypothetical protein n=1 Tax=Streptomyces sp. NBC_01262 TaxID=2903803 RepID=UPI002E3365D2|nr:hypothetical protein [Streptomyces sp. NBC_01262]